MTRKKDIQVDSTHESDDDSPNPSPKRIARKRGRPPKTKNKRQRIQDDDSDDDVPAVNGRAISPDDSDESSGSDTDASNPMPKRKRGRPPKAKNKIQRVQDESDDDVPALNGRATSPDDSDESSGSDTDASKPLPKKRGRPKNKVQRSQDDSDDDGSPQPSTSSAANGIVENDSERNSSGSETPDSDYGPMTNRSQLQEKVRKKKATQSTKHQKMNNAINSSRRPLNQSRLNISSRKNGKLSQGTSHNFDPKVVESLAEKLVYFLLIEVQRKYAIKRKAIVASVFKDEMYSPKLYIAVINKANSILMKIYGMELMELENQKDSYLIVNVLRRESAIQDSVEMSRFQQKQYALILSILTVIFMNDNIISEDELIKSLKAMGIDLTSKKVHPEFGDVKKYVTTELVRQMYLDYYRASNDPVRYEFAWGIRAKQEFDKRDLLQFACEIMDDTIPEDWKIQYQDAEKSANS